MAEGLPDAWADVPHTRSVGAVDRAAFERDIRSAHRPCILRGQADNWPIVAAGRQGPEALARYLNSHATDETAELWAGGPELGGRFRYQPDFRALNFERKLATIPQICTLLLRCLDEAEPISLFAGAIYLPKVMPAIVPELPMPLLADGQERLTSLWIGNRSRTAAHYDRPHNLACAVSGERRFLLFPTEQIANLYVGPVDFTIAGQAISLVDCEAPDFDRHPKFKAALAAAELAVLAPGDVLYIPPLWWHYVASPSPMGALVNFWWMEAAADRLGPMDSLMHAMLTLRHAPVAERAGWKAIFDHYIFDHAADDMDHIPEGGRGILGELDDQERARIRQYLADQLRLKS